MGRLAYEVITERQVFRIVFSLGMKGNKAHRGQGAKKAVVCGCFRGNISPLFSIELYCGLGFG